METACLRIRFTPLLKNLQKENSKHCLEIVPEISCIQNLEKIQWRKEEDSIEYTIPMTYKIILRKKEIIKDSIKGVETLDKTYHSCVDLLLQSSNASLANFGSGDINRVVSDPFVLTKVTTDVERCSILLKEMNNGIVNDTAETATVQVQTEVNSNPSISSQLVHNDVIEYCKMRVSALTQTSGEVLQSASLIQVSDANIFDCIERSMDKITNTDLRVRTLKTANRVLAIKSITDLKQKLSLSPICSVNTHDEQLGPINAQGVNEIIFRVYESQNGYKNGGNKNIFKSDNLCMRNRETNCITNECEFINSSRLLPEVRVANFIQIIEREILPLKTMLGDIINKCAVLGLTRQKIQINSLMYRNVPNVDKHFSRRLKSKRENKSNRVVYSIVFDG